MGNENVTNPAAARGLLEGLSRIRHACALYSADHPAVDAAAREVAGRIRIACRAGSVRIDLLAEGAEGGADAMSRDLRARDICAVEFRRPLSATQTRRLGELLIAALKAGLTGESLGRHVERSTGGSIHLVAMKTSLMGARPGARAEGSAIRIEDAMRALATGAGPLAPADLAEALERGELELGVGGFDDLVDEVRELATSAPDGPTTARLREFVGALSPKLRRQLLSFDSARTLQSIELLDRFAETMSVAEVLDAIEAIDEAPRPAPPEALMLVRRLISIDDGGVSEELERLKLRLDESQFWSSAALEQSVEELLQRHSGQTYAPDDYNERLRELSGGVGGSTLANASARPDTVTMARVAGEVLAHTGPEAPAGAVAMRRVMDGLDDLVEGGEFELLFGAVRAASSVVYQRVDEAGRRAAEALLERVREPVVMDAVLAQTARAGALPPGAASLLTTCGKDGVAQVARFLVREDAGPGRAALGAWLAEVSDESVMHALERLAQPRPDAFGALLEATEKRPQLIDGLLAHSSAPVRAAAIEWISSGDRWRGDRLRSALLDESSAVRAIVITRLEQRPEQAPVKDIGRILRAERGLPRFGRGDRMRLVQVLAATEPGMKELGKSLRLLAGMIRPRAAARARWLAGALKPWADHPRIKTPMRAWKQSPGRLVLLASRVLAGGPRG